MTASHIEVKNVGQTYRSRRRRVTRLAMALSAIAALASACNSTPQAAPVASLPNHGGPTTTSVPLTQDQSNQDFVDYTHCLRAHGVNEPDPTHRPGHAGLTINIPTPNASNRSALDACQHLIAAVVQRKEAGARSEIALWLPQLTQYAQCMRTHGIEMLDPSSQPSPAGLLALAPNNTFGRDSSQFKTADTACRHLLPAAVHDDGTGP